MFYHNFQIQWSLVFFIWVWEVQLFFLWIWWAGGMEDALVFWWKAFSIVYLQICLQVVISNFLICFQKDSVLMLVSGVGVASLKVDLLRFWFFWHCGDTSSQSRTETAFLLLCHFSNQGLGIARYVFWNLVRTRLEIVDVLVVVVVYDLCNLSVFMLVLCQVRQIVHLLNYLELHWILLNHLPGHYLLQIDHPRHPSFIQLIYDLKHFELGHEKIWVSLLTFYNQSDHVLELDLRWHFGPLLILSQLLQNFSLMFLVST